MNKLIIGGLLTAALLGSGATAQTAPASPTPPAVRAPATPAPLLLTAPTGTSVTLQENSTLEVELEDIQATGAAADMLRPKDIRELRSLFGEMSGMDIPGSQMLYRVGQVFPDGSRELIITATTEVPSEDGEGSEDLTFSMIQTVEKSGKITALRLESADPVVQAMFSDLPEDVLSSMTPANGLNVYGFPLVKGHSVTKTETVDMQALLGGMLGGLLSAAEDLPADEQAAVAEVFSSMKLEPMVITTTTTYQGVNRAGNHLFSQKTNTQPWSMKFSGELPEGAGDFGFEITLQDISGSAGELVYRPDGLPVQINQAQELRAMMTFNITGEEAGSVSMAMRMKIASKLQAE